MKAANTIQSEVLQARLVFEEHAVVISRAPAGALPVTCDHAGVSATPDIQFLADRYMFEYFYLRRDTGQSFANSGQALDLMSATVHKLIAPGLNQGGIRDSRSLMRPPNRPGSSDSVSKLPSVRSTFDS